MVKKYLAWWLSRVGSLLHHLPMWLDGAIRFCFANKNRAIASAVMVGIVIVAWALCPREVGGFFEDIGKVIGSLFGFVVTLFFMGLGGSILADGYGGKKGGKDKNGT